MKTEMAVGCRFRDKLVLMWFWNFEQSLFAGKFWALKIEKRRIWWQPFVVWFHPSSSNYTSLSATAITANDKVSISFQIQFNFLSWHFLWNVLKNGLSVSSIEMNWCFMIDWYDSFERESLYEKYRKCVSTMCIDNVYRQCVSAMCSYNLYYLNLACVYIIHSFQANKNKRVIHPT